MPWVGRHILHLSYAITVFPNGSGDTTYNYVEVLCFLAVCHRRHAHMVVARSKARKL